jgi:predicted HAD superfamily Cof-like phosphohydrolase
LRTPHQQKVDEFMKLALQDVPEKPVVPSKKTRELRCRLILEEVIETINALGFDICVDEEYTLMTDDLNTGFISFTEKEEGPDLIEIADGCADIKVVTTGTLTACGIDDEELQEEVDNNNLAKFGPGGHRRDDGKWVKPADHQPPNIKGILEKQSEG